MFILNLVLKILRYRPQAMIIRAEVAGTTHIIASQIRDQFIMAKLVFLFTQAFHKYQ